MPLHSNDLAIEAEQPARTLFSIADSQILRRDVTAQSFPIHSRYGRNSGSLNRE